MPVPLAVLIIEDTESDVQLVTRALKKAGYEINFEQVETAEQMRAALEKQAWDIVISDYSLPQFNGPTALKILQEMELDIPFLTVSGTIGEETAVDMMRAGAHDYLMKGNLARLASAIERELAQTKVRRERKQAQEALAASESELRALFASMHDAVLVIDHDGVYRKIGPTRPLNVYKPPEELLGKSLAEIFPEEQARFFLDTLRQVLATGQTTQIEYQLNFDGRTPWFEASISPMTADSTLWVARDISERKQAEEAVELSHKRFRALIENSADAITLLDANGIAVYDSPAAPGMLGYGPDELIGQNVFTLMHPDDLPINQDQFQNLLKTPGARTRGTFRVRHRSGTWLWIEAVATNLLAELSVKAIVVNYRDVSERKQAEERIQRQIEQLTGLRMIDRAITASFELQLTLNVLLEQITTLLRVDAANVLLLNPHFHTLEFSSGRGFRTKAIESTRLRLGESYAGRAALERRLIHISNLQDSPDPILAKRLTGENFVCYCGVPLIVKGQVKGVLEVFHRTHLNLDPDWQEFLETLAGQAAIAVDNAELFNNLHRSNAELMRAYDATIEGWSHALDLRDKETEGHTRRVTEMTLRLAQAMGQKDEELMHIRRGALLHDIGKLGVPDNILLKPDKLTDDEWVLMKKHPQYAYDMLLPIDYLRRALDIPYCHHEKWDGTGYPRGLKGDQIPVSARIFSVVDVWDALRSDRPYRAGWSEEKVREYIRQQSGIYFDPQAVEMFLKMEM